MGEFAGFFVTLRRFCAKTAQVTVNKRHINVTTINCKKKLWV